MKKATLILAAGTLLFLAACAGVPPVAAPVQEEPQQSGDIKLTVGFQPEYFSPDNDGTDDTLSITLGVESGDASRIASWSFDIQDPAISQREGQPVRILKHYEGTAALPTDPIVWDGSGDPREFQTRAREGQPSETRTYTPRVQSATEYPCVFSVKDADGNEIGSVTATIFVDIMVRKTDDGKLRIQVPSIRFQSNSAEFDERFARSNERVIERIAAALSRFPDYKVRIEGHANPENAPGTTARSAEEKEEKKANSISERRAKKVMDMLVEHGIAQSRMTAVGMGVSTPVAEFENQDRAWMNRRVEFYLEK
jgi:outer membrane protein OmpA-like peptidoglycan-associated protein